MNFRIKKSHRIIVLAVLALVAACDEPEHLGGTTATNTGQDQQNEETTDATTSTPVEDPAETQGNDQGDDDEEDVVPTACTDEEEALRYGCVNRESWEFYIREGTTNPCNSDDYCGYIECGERWSSKLEGVGKRCDAKYPLCAALRDKSSSLPPGNALGCISTCLDQHSACKYRHYCAVGGPDNEDPEVMKKCTDDYSACMGACAPLPPMPAAFPMRLGSP